MNSQLFIYRATVNNLDSGIQSEKPAHKIISSVYQVVDEFLSLFPVCVVTVNSDRCVRPARFGFALLEHSQLSAPEVIPGSESALWTEGKPEEGGQVARQCDYRFDTSHGGQYLAMSWGPARFGGDCNLENQQDSIIAGDKGSQPSGPRQSRLSISDENY